MWETAMNIYRAALVGCSRMGAFIDNEQRGGVPVPPAVLARGRVRGVP